MSARSKHRARRPGAALLLALGAIAAPALAATALQTPDTPASASDRDPPIASAPETVRTALLPGTSGPLPDAAALLSAAAMAGPEGAEALVTALRLGKIPAAPRGPGRAERAPEIALAPTSGAGARLAGLAPAAREAIGAAPSGATTPPLLAASALRVLSLLGDRSDVLKPLQAANPLWITRLETETEVLEEFTAMMAALLGRDEVACSHLDAPYRAAPGMLRLTILRALGAARTPSAALALADLLGTDEQLEVETLMQLGRCASGRWVDLGEMRIAPILARLRADRPEVRREAALALGRLEHSGSAERLIEALGDPAPAVGDAALWSLRKLSGLRLPASPASWRRWLTAERAWWDDLAPDALARLESDSTAEIVAGLRAVAPRRLHRRVLAERVAPLLRRSDPSLARLACAALQGFGSAAAIPALVDALEHEDPSVRESAATALRAITGEQRPTERAAWAALVP